MTQPAKGAGRKPTDIDRIVGANVKALRKQCGLTQVDLGDAVGLSFKQIRKYESGENRISASVLFLMSKALEKPVSAFYDGIQTVQTDPIPVHSDEARELGMLFASIPKKHERKALLRLVTEISRSPIFSAG